MEKIKDEIQKVIKTRYFINKNYCKRKYVGMSDEFIYSTSSSGEIQYYLFKEIIECCESITEAEFKDPAYTKDKDSD